MDVLYVVRHGNLDYEFASPNDVFGFVIRGLESVPEEYLPVSCAILNIDEFSRDEIERDFDGYIFRSELRKSRLGKAFRRYWQTEEEAWHDGLDCPDQ